MSLSPPIRRLSLASTNSKREENLINAYEAEEERIINILSRKLERLREEKIDLENALEAESESHVNRLTRELSALRMAQQTNGNGSVSVSPEARLGLHAFMSMANPNTPSAEVMLEAMRRENEQLRNRLVDTERDYVRVSRLNEIYREELIDHRRRLGLPVDNLIGLSSPDPYSQPTHRRSSNASSPSASLHPSHLSHLIHGMPIPRPPSQIQIQRSNHTITSESTTPLSHSASSSESPFPFSPETNATSLASANTNITTPPSSASNPATYTAASVLQLSYPSVPPPSLSSSFGSPNVAYHIPHRDTSLSPIEPLSRRNSRRRLAESGNLRSISQSRSIERGARVAETGTLIPRNRASSQSLEPTSEVSTDGE